MWNIDVLNVESRVSAVSFYSVEIIIETMLHKCYSTLAYNDTKILQVFEVFSNARPKKAFKG